MHRSTPRRVVVPLGLGLGLGSSIAVLAAASGCTGGAGSLGESDADIPASDSAIVPGDAASSPPSDGSGGGSDGAKRCITVDPASYTKDAPCTKDTDCTSIQTGQLCDGQCMCSPNFAVAIAEASKYADAIRSVSRPLCDCAATVQVRCLAQACSLCTPTGDGGCTKL